MKKPVSDAVAHAIECNFSSPNECDSNDNVVDGLFFIGRAIDRLAKAIEKHGQPITADEEESNA